MCLIYLMSFSLRDKESGEARVLVVVAIYQAHTVDEVADLQLFTVERVLRICLKPDEEDAIKGQESEPHAG